jgi:hypothetical protein
MGEGDADQSARQANGSFADENYTLDEGDEDEDEEAKEQTTITISHAQ